MIALVILKRPDNLSNGAWEILQVLLRNFANNKVHVLEDFSCFDFSESELHHYCEELHDKRLVFFESRDTPRKCLYMLPFTGRYVKKQSSYT